MHYDENVVITTADSSDDTNGNVYRRGYNYTNAMGGAELIGNIFSGMDVSSNVELVDIRVGADGNQYSSAGDAVRQQIGTLKSDIDDLNEMAVTWNDNKYVNSAGNLANGPATSTLHYLASDYVDIHGAFYISFENYLNYALYDKDKQVISVTNTGLDSAVKVVIAVLKDVYYIRFTKEIIQHNSQYYMRVANLFSMGEALRELTGDEQTISNAITYHDHAYIKASTGEITSISASYYYSDVIELNKWDKISIYAKGAPTVSAISRWNEHGSEWLGNIKSYTEALTFENIDYVASETEYIRISYYGTLPIVKVSSLSALERINLVDDKYDTQVDSIHEDITELKTVTQKIKTNYLAMYKGIVCCGDSLTYGAVYLNASGSLQAFQPYPAVLGMLCGQEIESLAVGGYTATDWWNAFGDQISGSNKLYIVYLGTNGGLTNTVGTDCAGNDLTQFANTHTGNYGRILQKIADTHSKAILIKIYSSSGGATITNQAIDAFASKYNTLAFDKIYLDDDYFHYYRGSTSGKNAVHLNDAGYCRFASILYDKICELNPSDAYKIAPDYSL